MILFVMVYKRFFSFFKYPPDLVHPIYPWGQLFKTWLSKCRLHKQIHSYFLLIKCEKRILILSTKYNQRTNGPVNAHLRSAAYTNKHV